MFSEEHRLAWQVCAGAFVYLALLITVLGAYPGHNYDSYQYVYATVQGAELTETELAEFSRMHVHSGYYPMWRVLIATGLPAWPAFTWLNVFCTALTTGVIYLICRSLKIGRLLAALAAAFFLSSTSVAYYSSIPEIYPPWMLLLAVFIWSVLSGRLACASIAYGLSMWMFLQSILLWPAFWLRASGRPWKAALTGLVLGTGLHLVTISAYGIELLPRLAGETVYFRVISGWQWFFTSTWKTLSLAGVLWGGLLYAVLVLRNRKPNVLRRLELLALPSLLAPAIWVKDHGSFFLPLILLLSLLGAAALHRWTAKSRTRRAAAVLLVIVMLTGNVTTAWESIAYDRSAGKAQLTYCRSALDSMPENSRVLSTAFYSTWLWACTEAKRDDVECAYFPWLLRPDYEPIMQDSLQRLLQRPGTYYVDSTVSSVVSEAGRIISTWEVAVPAWPKGTLKWPLQVVDFGGYNGP